MLYVYVCHEIKTQMSNLVCTTPFGNNHRQVCLQPNYIKGFVSKKTKEQDSQNRQKSPMLKGENLSINNNNNYMIRN